MKPIKVNEANPSAILTGQPFKDIQLAAALDALEDFCCALLTNGLTIDPQAGAQAIRNAGLASLVEPYRKARAALALVEGG